MAALIQNYFDGGLHCKRGCSDCCIEFSVLPLEAAIIQETHGLHSLQKGDKQNVCPFLENRLCRIYSHRPIICRSQGMAIGYINDEKRAIEVSGCQLNFTDDYEFSPEQLLMLDEYNAQLAELNNSYCEKNGLDPFHRIALSEIA